MSGNRKEVTECGKIEQGTWADTVLEIKGKPIWIERIGEDSDGFIVEWGYDDYVFTMARANANDGIYDITAYGVQKIEEIVEGVWLEGCDGYKI